MAGTQKTLFVRTNEKTQSPFTFQIRLFLPPPHLPCRHPDRAQGHAANQRNIATGSKGLDTRRNGRPSPYFLDVLVQPSPCLPQLRTLLLGLAGVTFSACGSPIVLPDGVDSAAETFAVDLSRGQLSGQVTDTDGNPIVGAFVTTVPGGREAQTDATGTYTMDRLYDGPVSLVVAAQGWAMAEVGPVDIQAGIQAEQNIILAPRPITGGVVTVHVDGPDDLPLANATVQATSSTGTILATAFTDDEGNATLTGVVDDAPQLDVFDPSGRVLPAHIDAPPITEAGGFQWSTPTSGHPPVGTAYLGSHACGACHPDHRDGWSNTAHARALSDEASDDLFDQFVAGTVVDLASSTAELGLTSGSPSVTLVDNTGARRRFTIQGYIGDPTDRTVPWVEEGGVAWPLPLAWVAEDPHRPDYPEPIGRLVPYQVDRWFDGGGQFVARLPERSAESECFACHATGFELTWTPESAVSMETTRGYGRWFEGAVGCERCHGAGGDHRPATADGTELDVIVQPERLDARRGTSICAQCHSKTSAHGTDLPFPLSDEGWFEPGDDLTATTSSAAQFWPSGAAASPHMQVDELQTSPHGEAGLVCVDCHDPHSGAPVQLRASADDNTLCMDCHLSLSFDNDRRTVEAHLQHVRIDPDGRTEGGRCIGCHMPATAAGVDLDPLSGAGDLSSHRFVAFAPSTTLDVFDALGADTLPLGSFPTHACADCHAWNAWYWAPSGVPFPGPAGDPTLRASHVEHQAAFEEKYP